MIKDMVSIIVPVYNVEKYIEKCLSSLASQTYDSLEFILVSDGSKLRKKDISQYIFQHCKIY